MKTKLWLVCGLTLCASVLAQQGTNNPPAPLASPGPAPAMSGPATSTADAGSTTNKTAAGKKKKAPTKSAANKKKASNSTVAKSASEKPSKAVVTEARTVPLKPGVATVIASNVNVRGQAKLKSEVVTRLTKGQQVTVLEEITLSNSGPDEPSAWAKIVLPEGSHAWVNSGFIEPSTKAVKPRRLNLRSGPGENYSVIGRIEHGETVKEIETKGDWMQIEPPTNCYAFIAAQYLQQQETAPPPVIAENPTPAPPPTSTPATIPEATPPSTNTAPPPAPTALPTTQEPAPTPTTVATAPAVAAAPTEVPTPPPGTQTAVAPVATNAAVPPPTPEIQPPAPSTNAVENVAGEETGVPRIVQHEGVVRGTVSIQAPTKFELVSPDTGKAINYLYSTSRELDLSRYKGLRIVVTGEEALDERWRNTPVLTIQRIQVLEE